MFSACYPFLLTYDLPFNHSSHMMSDDHSSQKREREREREREMQNSKKTLQTPH